jgi:DNA polymerase I
MTKIFLYQKDYTENGRDRLFLWKAGEGVEVTALNLVEEPEELICHDYWLIAPSIYRAVGKLPARVIDIEDFRITTSGQRTERAERERRTVVDSLSDLCDGFLLNSYIDIFDRRSNFDASAFFFVAPYIIQQFDRLVACAEKSGELDRYFKIEVPVFNLLTLSAAKGIQIDTQRLRGHKDSIEHEYYMALKNFAVSYDLPFEVPKEENVRSYLEPRGFDCDGVSLDYILKFVPMPDNFAADLLALKRLAESRFVLAAMSVNRKRVFPVVDIFGSITSRIYYRDPAIQNLAKRHRDIVVPDDGLEMSYVDLINLRLVSWPLFPRIQIFFDCMRLTISISRWQIRSLEMHQNVSLQSASFFRMHTG